MVVGGTPSGTAADTVPVDSPVDCASQGQLYLQLIDLGRRMVVGSDVIYHIALREGEPGIVIKNELWIVYTGSRDENGSNWRVKETV